MRLSHGLSPMRNFTGGAVIAVLMAMPAAAEQAGVEPAYAVLDARSERYPATLRHLNVRGKTVSIVAYGRQARADTHAQRELLNEARSMEKVMPGYPQPAYVTIDLKLAF